MRIVMVTEVYYPLVGGIQDHVTHLAEELRRRGNTVKVLTTSYGSAAGPEEMDDVVRLGRGIQIRANKSFARITVGWRLPAKVKRFFNDFRPDIVHTHGSLAPTLPILGIGQSHAVNVATFHAGHRKSSGYMLFRPLLLPYFRHLHGLIAVSETAEAAMSKYFKGDYEIIPNGIDTNEFRPGVPPPEGLRDKRKKILYMNRLEPKKGLPHLIKALYLIKKEYPDVLLVVCGSGPFEKYYKNMVDDEIAPNVMFVGTVPAQPVSVRASYYCACDVFCAPSIGHESFGIVLLEAMACARPVVASDIDGYRHVMEDRREGFLVRRKDERRIARAILRLLRDSDLAKRMGEHGREKALRYDWSKVAEVVESYYLRLLRKYRGWQS